MNKEKYECNKLEWDTNYFKKTSARINILDILDEADLIEILNFASNYEFITIANLNNENENNIWIGQNTTAFLSDINIQFSKSIKMNQRSLLSKVVNKFSKNESLLDIARNSFNYSRFFNDPYLPQDQAKNIYLHWLESAFDREDKFFVIYENDNVVTGFILFSFKADAVVIELIAVDGKHQGEGIGRSMIHDLEIFAFERGIEKILVGTQVNNYSATQFYLSMEFELISCNSIYHLWRNQIKKVEI